MKLTLELASEVIRDATVGVLIFDPHSNQCIYMNDRAKEILEIYSDHPEQVPTFSITDLMPETDIGDYPRIFTHDYTRYDGFHEDVMLKRASGFLFIGWLGVRRITIDQGYLCLMITDVTEQKKIQKDLKNKEDEILKAYQELEQQNQQLRALDAAKDKFIALVAHELRTPLSAVVATADVLRLELHESEDQRKEFTAAICEQGLQLMEIVNGILDLAKIKAGSIDIYISEIDVIEVAQQVVDNYKQMADKAKLVIELIAPAEPVKAWADAIRLGEVVANLVSNAIKYNRDTGWVKVEVKADGALASVAVSDSGPGIPEQHLASVFNEFETLGQISKHTKGTGLGLPIAKQFAEGMGGRIDLQSTVGVGSTFTVFVPQTKILSEDRYRERPNFEDMAA